MKYSLSLAAFYPHMPSSLLTMSSLPKVVCLGGRGMFCIFWGCHLRVLLYLVGEVIHTEVGMVDERGFMVSQLCLLPGEGWTVSLAQGKDSITPIDNLHSMSKAASLLFWFSLYHINLKIKVRGIYFKAICFRRGRKWVIYWGRAAVRFI